jgi:membrane protein
MAYGYKESRNFIIIKLTGIYYTLLLIISIIITIALPTLGLGFFHFISSYLPISVKIIDTIYSLRYLLYLMVFIFFILSVHKVLPAGKMKYRDVYYGAVFSLIGWYILSRSFGFFVSTFTNYAAVYGGLASIVIFMMWLYFMSTVLMLGAEMNSVILKYRKQAEQIE